MTSKSIQVYLEEGKTLHQDFISSSDNPHHTAALLSSFANSDGGTLVVGVNSKGKVIGVLPDTEEENIKFILQHFCTSHIELYFSKQEYKNKYVLQVSIPRALDRDFAALSVNATPHFFVRSITGEVFEANKIIEKSWVNERKGIDKKDELSPEEIVVCSIFETQSLSISQIYKSLNLKKSVIDRALSELISKNKVFYNFENQHVVYSLV